MVPEQQQRILGYFIEEAKDHLNTIEQGLLNLQATIGNPEMANEVFRAAHSVKGGAAMLGIESMQRTAHRMEDYFKLLKESPIQVDRSLESMFLRVFDALQDLLEQLQGPFGLTEEKEQSIMTAVEPVFQELQEHLDQLVRDAGAVELQAESTTPVVSPVSSPRLVEESALKLVFSSDVSAALREMLARFKQADTDDTRSAIEGCCRLFERFGEQFNLPAWMNLVKHARWAVCDRDHDYRTLAPVLIKEIKKAQDLVLAGREPEITISERLQTLAAQGDVTDTASELDNLFAEHELDSIPDMTDSLSELEPDLSLESSLGQPSQAASSSDSISIDELLNDGAIAPSGPEVGAAELTSLADLFEAGGDALDSDWQEEEIPINEGSPPAESLDIDIAPDFEDLLNEDVLAAETNSDDFESGDELADLFGDTDTTETADDSLNNVDSGFGNLSGETAPLTEMEASLSESFDTSMEGLFDDVATADDPSNFEGLFSDSELGDNDSESLLDTSDTSTSNLDDLFNNSENEGISTEISLEDSNGLDDFEALTSLESVSSEELTDDIEDLTDIDLAVDTSDDSPDDISGSLGETSQITDDFFTDQTSSENVAESSPSTQTSDFDDFFSVDNTPEETASDSLHDDLWTTAPASTATTSEPVAIDDLSNDIWDDPQPLTDAESVESISSDQQTPINLTSDIAELVQDATTESPDELELEDVWASVEDVDLEDETSLEIEEPSDTPSASIELDDLFNDTAENSALLEQTEGSEAPVDIELGSLFDNEENESSTESLNEIELDNLFDDENLENTASQSESIATADSSEASSDSIELDSLFDDGSETASLATELDQTDTDASDTDATGLDDLFSDTPASISTSENELDDLFSDGELTEETNTGAELQDLKGLESLELTEPTDSSETDLSLELENTLDQTDSVTELEEADESPGSTFDFDLLDLEDNGIVTGFVNDDGNLQDSAASASLESIDDFFSDSNEKPSEDQAQPQGLEALDSLLAELPEEPASESATTENSDDFGELENLIAEPSELANQEPETISEVDDEFGDLEALLQDTDQTLSTASVSSSPIYRPTSNRLAGRRTVADQTMRVSVGHLDNLSNLVGELVVNRNTLEQDQERLRQFLDNLLFQVQQLNDVGQRMRDLYERSLLESSLISSRQSYHMASAGAPAERTDIEGHATGESFDALEMDRFTGFHTLSQEMIELIVRVRESASDIAYTVESSDQVTRQFRQVTNQLQEGLNKARMVPFAQTASRLPRAVRDISLKCGKEARLVVEGRDILIDKMILEQLYDPMTHLVNNAITHGVETPEERSGAGKTPEGLITVRAFYQGNQTVISVGDDGAGIDPDIVKQKAIQKGLISEAEARTMTVLDVYDLLFHPGFSTRDQADDFAGRGFGMDVVRTSLADIRGNITIDSEPGRGTNFTIRLPLTLSISKALSCISNQARIAFPMDGVEDMFDVSRDRIQKNGQGQDCILWRDTLLPFQNLSDLLSFNRTLGRGRVYGGNQDENMISIVVLRSANSFIALEVDQVMGEQEIVIKQLEGPVPKPTGIAGATVLGDGRVMPIADVLELIDLAMGRVRREPNAALWAQTEDAPPEVPAGTKSEPTVLIVDDSITVRELLSMSFNKVGYRVEQARDGQEAWEKLRSGLPCDLVFCDIEMPRMDGLELLSRLQKDSGLQEIPIAMLTSRGADRHRQMAVDLGASGYFTKPYLEEALLDAANKMLHGEKLV